ncbi:MAG TPA: transcription factor, partial [Nitrososphaeraceae archaeon]|nr:transcription factor [Nitrososphaeraceae archaeon]
QRETPSLKEEDIILVMQQANVSKEKAIQALTDSKGDIAQAILTLTT